MKRLVAYVSMVIIIFSFAFGISAYAIENENYDEEFVEILDLETRAYNCGRWVLTHTEYMGCTSKPCGSTGYYMEGETRYYKRTCVNPDNSTYDEVKTKFHNLGCTCTY